MLTEEDRINLLQWSKRANAIISYIAAIQFIDAQFGKIYTTLLSHPEIMNNTIIIFIGDNGYGLGEKGIGQNMVYGTPMFVSRC